MPITRISHTDCFESPGMGLNAYFTYQVVGYHGTGPVSYRMALMAVFVEGFIFVFLSLIGMRQWLVKTIPASIKVASGVGIGLFLTEIGLSYSAGIGAITGSSITPTDLGGCPTQYLVNGNCVSHRMQSPRVSCPHPEKEFLLIPLIDVDWNPLWRYADSLFDGIQMQGSYHPWHLSRVYFVMAVRSVFDHSCHY